MQQALGMMDALGVSRDLLADDAQRVGVGARTPDPPDGAAIAFTNPAGALTGWSFPARRQWTIAERGTDPSLAAEPDGSLVCGWESNDHSFISVMSHAAARFEPRAEPRRSP